MFQIDKYYIHQYGVDAVILIHGYEDMGSGYELEVTWHMLSLDKKPLTPIDLQFLFISKEHAKEWREYEN